MPFPYNNKTHNNNMFLQSLMNNNNFGMNYNNVNNMNNFIQFQQNKLNIDSNNNSNIPSGVKMMFNYNNQ